MRTRSLTLSLLATVSVTVAAASAFTASPALADTPPGPDRTALIDEFSDWWTAAD
jgi:hypothetical protein